jgi:hypothetical protein
MKGNAPFGSSPFAPPSFIFTLFLCGEDSEKGGELMNDKR